MSQEVILNYLSQFIYEPTLVYLLIIGLLSASSFGLPVPEEVTLISAGLIGYLSRTTAATDSAAIQPITLAIVCFLAVFLSDFLVFGIGRYGDKILRKYPKFERFFSTPAFKKVETWTEKYGAIMSGVFRFTPGLRFPGHMACGFLGVPVWKFVAIDGTAALLTVPTQVLLVSYYGEYILAYFKQFKIALISLLVVLIIFYILNRYRNAKKPISPL
jgi:membrane protein DedA with SNARE-associated domain